MFSRSWVTTGVNWVKNLFHEYQSDLAKSQHWLSEAKQSILQDISLTKQQSIALLQRLSSSDNLKQYIAETFVNVAQGFVDNFNLNLFRYIANNERLKKISSNIALDYLNFYLWQFGVNRFHTFNSYIINDYSDSYLEQFLDYIATVFILRSFIKTTLNTTIFTTCINDILLAFAEFNNPQSTSVTSIKSTIMTIPYSMAYSTFGKLLGTTASKPLEFFLTGLIPHNTLCNAKNLSTTARNALLKDKYSTSLGVGLSYWSINWVIENFIHGVLQLKPSLFSSMVISQLSLQYLIFTTLLNDVNAAKAAREAQKKDDFRAHQMAYHQQEKARRNILRKLVSKAHQQTRSIIRTIKNIQIAPAPVQATKVQNLAEIDFLGELMQIVRENTRGTLFKLYQLLLPLLEHAINNTPETLVTELIQYRPFHYIRYLVLSSDFKSLEIFLTTPAGTEFSRFYRENIKAGVEMFIYINQLAIYSLLKDSLLLIAKIGSTIPGLLPTGIDRVLALVFKISIGPKIIKLVEILNKDQELLNIYHWNVVELEELSPESFEELIKIPTVRRYGTISTIAHPELTYKISELSIEDFVDLVENPHTKQHAAIQIQAHPLLKNDMFINSNSRDKKQLRSAETNLPATKYQPQVENQAKSIVKTNDKTTQKDDTEDFVIIDSPDIKKRSTSQACQKIRFFPSTAPQPANNNALPRFNNH